MAAKQPGLGGGLNKPAPVSLTPNPVPGTNVPGGFQNPNLINPGSVTSTGDAPINLTPLNPFQPGASVKGPFLGPAQFQGPAGDVGGVPVNQRGRLDKKSLKRLEFEKQFAFRPGDFPVNPDPTAFQRGIFDPDSPNPFDTPVAFSPEFNQRLLGFVQRPLEESRDEATRGLSQRFANLGRVGAGRFGQGAINIEGNFQDALSDAVTKIALQQSLGERAERLIGEERGFQSAETERNRRFQLSEGAANRRAQTQLGGGGSSLTGLPTAAAIGGGGFLQDILRGAVSGGIGKLF